MILSNIDEKMDENQRGAYSVGYSEGFDVGYQSAKKDNKTDSYFEECKEALTNHRDFLKNEIKRTSRYKILLFVLCIIMAILLVLISAGSLKAQEPQLIHAPGQLNELKTDTIPVSLLVRISGRPWAFFHDGWEVRKVSEDPGKYLPMQEPCDIPGCAVYHPLVLRPGKTYSHLLYLDSRKRPIRKEWVVYQTFKR